MEIGSIFEIDPSIVGKYKKEPMMEIQLAEVEKYGKKKVRYTASGREAITLAIRDFKRRGTCTEKCCLCPAYMCDAVFAPFWREGFHIYFYHVNKNLEVSEEELVVQVEKWKPSIVFVHPYYGIDTWKEARHLLGEWKKNGICIMEDVTQSYYLDHVGKEADYIVASLRKWYPIPDGGVLASDFDISEGMIQPEGKFAARKAEILKGKWNYLNGLDYGLCHKAEFLRENQEAEEWLDSYSGISSVSSLAAGILSHIDEGMCKQRREGNYQCLEKGIQWGKEIFPLISRTLEEGRSPLYFPIYVHGRERLQVYLSSHGIYAPVLWPLGIENGKFLTGDEEFIYKHLLALPMDQRYGREEMEYIIDTINGYGGWDDIYSC